MCSIFGWTNTTATHAYPLNPQVIKRVVFIKMSLSINECPYVSVTYRVKRIYGGQRSLLMKVACTNN